MGRENGVAATAAHAVRRSGAVQKHKKKSRYERGNTPAGLVARPAVPKLKHKTIFEWAENTDKKKKLEIEVTKNRNPRPGFTFIPIGNPELTNVCKELSREQGALVYIVSTTAGKSLTDLSDHTHRLGYHFRTQILEEALSGLEDIDPSIFIKSSGGGDPIPDDQDEINKQADAAIRDLFPRIPNTDREIIIRHAFQKGAVFNGKPVVGLQKELTLSRRVQLAVIAHIRHTHTRYDNLLRETTWEHARRAVEPLTLDILVKWRGDEETGRDQLEEVLREIVILDDSDDEEEDDEDDDEEEEEADETGEEKTDDELEEGEVSEAEPAVQQKTPAPEFISLLSSPLRPTSQTASISGPKRVRVHDPAISSRTRSKTNPKPNSKRTLSKGQAKRARRRQRAWQAARDRVNQQSLNQNSAITPRESGQALPGHSHPNILSSTDYSNLPPDLRNRPYNQSIYAIDDRPQRPRRVSDLFSPAVDANRPYFGSTEAQQILVPSSQPIAGPSTPVFGEQVNMRYRIENVRTMDQGYGYDPRPRLSGPASVNEPRTATGGYVTSPRGPSVKEKVLPSIEKHGDLESERAHMRTPSSPGRHSQVMYSHPEPVRGLPAGSNIVYIDDGDRQSKRQRLLLANGESLPIYDDPGDGSFRPIRRAERPAIYGDESSELARLRRVPVTGQRGEELPFISDDGRRLMRVVRRVPASESRPRDQLPIQPPAYSIQRAEDQLYVSSARPAQSMRESRPVESAPVRLPVLREQPSHTFQRTAPDNSNYLSNFPIHSQSRSHEMNPGVVSYAVSRHIEPESRFLPARHESQVDRSQPSLQFPPQRFSVDHPDRGTRRREAPPRQFDIGEMNRHRNEQLYVPTDAYGRIRDAGIRPPVQDMISGPMHHRGLPLKGEVIVLE